MQSIYKLPVKRFAFKWGFYIHKLTRNGVAVMKCKLMRSDATSVFNVFLKRRLLLVNDYRNVHNAKEGCLL